MYEYFLMFKRTDENRKKTKRHTFELVNNLRFQRFFHLRFILKFDVKMNWYKKRLNDYKPDWKWMKLIEWKDRLLTPKYYLISFAFRQVAKCYCDLK